MRLTSSCSTCRSRKKKCIPHSSSAACTLCTFKQLDCDLPQIRRNHSRRTLSQVNSVEPLLPHILATVLESEETDVRTPASPFVDILWQPVCDELIDMYFEMVHNKQQILFHRETFLTERSAKALPDFLVLGVVALMARFSSNVYFHGTERKDRAMPILQRALKLFNTRSQLISLHSLQACILLAFVCFVEGDNDQDSLLAAQAVRMTQILRLSEELSVNPTQREIEIRIFWQALMMDTWYTTHKRLPRQLISKPTMPAPLEEDQFEKMTTEQLSSTSLGNCTPRRDGIWANVIRLNETYAEIVHMVSMCAHQLPFTFMEEDKVRMLTFQLDCWLENLSTHLQNTPENLATFTTQGRGRELAVMHLIYHHQSQLLYYPFLGKVFASNAGTLDQQTLAYAARCKSHAKALSELMWTTNTTPGLECLWSPLNGHLLVVASSVHLHSLLCDEDPMHVPTLKRLLEQNFVMLLQFQEYWPTLRLSISRLQAFHRSCHRCDRRSMFQMDAWMAEFLNHYDEPVSDRSPIMVEDDTLERRQWDPDIFWSELRMGDENRQRAMQSSLSFR